MPATVAAPRGLAAALAAQFRTDEAFLAALGARRLPDPTTAGDFCRRFTPEAVEALQAAYDASNLYITRTELHELLAQTFDEVGQPDSAVAHYRAVVQAWQQADTRFMPRRLAAEARLGLLATPPRARPSRRSAS